MKVLCLAVLVAVTLAAPQFPGGGPMGGPPPFGGPPPMGGFPPLPPQLKAVLPPDVVTKLEAIHNDNSLGFKEKHEQIDKIMSSLPADVLDKIPPPPGFAQLPQDVQQKLKEVNRNPNLSWEDKQKATRQIIESLPENLRRLLPPPPPMRRGFF
ncbi:hypothetical protein FO519_006742 [Halicephalobus sp. NKZ332]|nr:hypothetical protein FO519_006742 [Halicephalobus sp. NKZ332]